MEALTYILLGAAMVAYGWYRVGVTESRTTAVVTGAAALILAGTAIFNPAGSPPSVPLWALMGLSAIFGGLAALTALWEVTEERTLGLYSLFFAVAALLIAGALASTGASFLGAGVGVILAVVFGLLFLSGILPAQSGFRRFTGWVTLIGGAVVALIGFAPLLGVA